MNRIRVKKDSNYTVINNTIFKDKNISLKARGLFSTIMRLPEDWTLTIEGLRVILKEGRDAISNAIKELIENGYCMREQLTDDKGKFNGYDYVFTEYPLMSEPYSEKPFTGNHEQLSTNQSSTNRLNKKSIKKESHSPIGSFDTSGENEKKERQEKHHSNFEQNPIQMRIDETSDLSSQKKEKEKIPLKRKRKTAEEKQLDAINEHWSKVKGLGREKGEAKEAFLQVWNAYDKKNYHKSAINEFAKYWKGAKNDTPLDELLAHIKRYVNSTPEKQYRRNLSSYLNDGMYLYPVAANTPKTTVKSDKPISLI